MAKFSHEQKPFNEKASMPVSLFAAAVGASGGSIENLLISSLNSAVEQYIFRLILNRQKSVTTKNTFTGWVKQPDAVQP
jgi:hypothetical protein